VSAIEKEKVVLKRVGLIVASCALLRAATASGEFVAGADLSHLAFMESKGIAYREAGVAGNAAEILRERGINCARLRLFTSSAAQAQADPYNYTNNLAYNLPLAVRIKAAGLQLLLDFHYSDTWADPSHQAKPSAWTSLSFADLKTQMRLYNSNCIQAFRTAGAMPDYVQVGNEITQGMLWPDGLVGGTNDTWAQWSKLAQLMTNAIQGVRDASGTNMPKIIVHIDRGGDWGGTQWFFDKLTQQSVPFDIIGESYYPFWHGSLSNLNFCVTNAARRFNKPVIIAETAFPWTNSYWTTNVLGLPPTTNGQVQFVVALASALQLDPAGPVMGIFWWGPEYQRVKSVNTAGFHTTSFFDASGNVLPSASVFGQLSEPVRLSANLTGDTLALAWPLAGAGLALNSSTSLMETAQWVTVTNTVQYSGAAFRVALPLSTNPKRFYRLEAD
jgi:arabinogalactan endo-1,4-beta-galactosidase